MTPHIAQAVVTTGKVAGAVGKGALESLFDAVKIPVDMAMHPIETAKSLGHLAVVAKNFAMGDVQTRQKFQDMLTACKQLPFEQKAEHLTRFVVGVLAPGPVALTRSAGFAKGLTALGNAISKEIAAVKAGLNTLAQASKPERALSVAGTQIVQKLPASVLREAENVAKSKPVVELVKKADLAKIEWTNHGYKHFPSKNMLWKDIIAATKNGAAKYMHGINVEKLERLAWENGQWCRNGKPWKVMKFESIIGAKNGIETNCIRVEFSANTIHGHPITLSEYEKLLI